MTQAVATARDPTAAESASGAGAGSDEHDLYALVADDD